VLKGPVGLMHVSQLSDQCVKDPSEMVKVAQPVNVTVVEVDLPRKRIALSMKAAPLTLKTFPALWGVHPISTHSSPA